MSGSGQTMFRGFGAEYTGPGSPGYNYATPEAQAVADMAASYTGPAYADPNRSYVGPGTVNTSYREESVAGSAVPAGGGYDVMGTLFGSKSSERGVVGSLLDIFRGSVQQPMYAPPPSPGVPVWVWLAIPVGVLGVVLLTRKKSSVAGYRRRKSRR